MPEFQELAEVKQSWLPLSVLPLNYLCHLSEDPSTDRASEKGEAGSGCLQVLLTVPSSASALASHFPKWGNGLMSGLAFLKLTFTLS